MPAFRILKYFIFLCSAASLFAVQEAKPDFARELQAGKTAAEQNQFGEAISHFNAANQIEQGRCSECYLWIARIYLIEEKNLEAVENTEKAISTAASDAERSRAQLYKGMALARQSDLPGAEAAFKAALSANPACVECSFNLGFVLLKEKKDAEGVAVLKSIAPHFAGTPRGREMQRFIDDPSRVRKHYAPEFSARSLTGEEISLDTLKGKVVLLDFWGTWCAPCRVSLPKLKELAATVDPAKVAIVSIDENEPRDKWEQFVKANNMSWSQVYDGDRALYRTFNVDGFPRYYLLSKDGIILLEWKGWSETGEATISTAIAAALKQ